MLRCLSFVVLLAVLAVAPASAERRVAIVIGNGAYLNTPPLVNPRNDATAVAAAMKRVGFEVIEGHDLDKRGMDDALRRFARAAADADAAVFYYAGHGMQFAGQNYLMPVDAKLESEIDLGFEMTSVGDVMTSLERARGVKVLMLDACRDNPLASQLARRASATRNVGATRGLAPIERASGMVVAYATQAGAVAADGADHNSPFTKALLTHIEEPGLEIARLFRIVARDVHASTGGKQLPELSLSVLGDFFFAPPRPGESAPTAAPVTQPTEAPASSIARLEAPDPQAEAAVAECDRLAASPLDVDRPSGAPGVPRGRLDPGKVITACEAASRLRPADRRVLFQLGRAYDAAGDLGSARRWLEKAAAAGSISAVSDLALMLETGEGGPKDIGRAAALFDRAAAAGNVAAMRNVGIQFEAGAGRPRDAAKAAEWYRRASETGDPQAMGFLAILYLQGTGVPKNAGEAKSWIDRIVETEDTPTMLRVGHVLLGTTGAVKDYRTARMLFARAAELRDAEGYVLLGSMSALGLGTKIDHAEARRQFEKAASLGSASGKASLVPFLIAGAGGMKRDPAKAATYALESLRARSPVARDFLVTNWRTALDPATRLAIEQRLAADGFLKRRPDGSYGADTLAALAAYATTGR